jgi:hypothetical protein
LREKPRARRWTRGPIGIIYLAVVLVFIACLAATTFIVSSRLADELVENTRMTIVNRALSATSTISSVLSLAADESMNLMSAYDARALSEEDLRSQLGKIQAGLTGCSGAWIVPLGGKPIVSLGTPLASPESRSWWREYLGLHGAERLGTFGNLGIRRNIGFVGAPFRGGTGIGTILPLVVSYYVGTVPAMTAFLEIDMTVILNELMKTFEASSVFEDYPMELSFYDEGGRLVETTRNLPLVLFPPFESASLSEAPAAIGTSMRDILAPGDKTIEARYKDNQLNLLCVARVPAEAVMKGVRRVAVNVVAIGLAALLAVVVLGFMLLQAFRRARSFEKEQLAARFEALQAKINPHFLFNTFDSMIGVAEARDHQTLLRMIKALSSMLHVTVRGTEDIVSLADELEYVRCYIAIQEVRYRKLFSWAIEADGSLSDTHICRFGIQPLVENCFTHGVHEGQDGMRISVAARLEGKSVLIDVTDDGPGCPPGVAEALRARFSGRRERLDREGGLYSVHDRIRMTFGFPYGLELMELERGFGIRLRIPR